MTDKTSSPNIQNLNTSGAAYGTLDASFQAAGGEQGVKQLVDDFYDIMMVLPEAKKIFAMHPEDNAISRDKLYRFLCGWMGGPKLYREKYGPISIPQVHKHLTIGYAEKNAWLTCMQQAIAKQPYAEDFKEYLYFQLSKPAEVVRNSD
ncbi:group II truncated hemoglobin [Pleionea sp. CnH1-48]|uniref:group II truncated hemoglobin n=1 Tax=Pleionea sp. CnH1-48 TaxID=2954494 RepID=UPI0020972749|nr:group II truncated hemoglobin [Pleionea sp. CnH1-48]MCO7226290.1 group II truncated hemoglobin [Pleionea sp. CnH1-48]